MNYVCQLCGYVYKVSKGDPENNVEPETEFDEIPDNWCCPLCGAGKEDFDVATDDDYEDDE